MNIQSQVFNLALMIAIGAPIVQTRPVEPSPAAGGALIEQKTAQTQKVDDFSRGRIDASVKELQEERDAVQALGLL